MRSTFRQIPSLLVLMLVTAAAPAAAGVAPTVGPRARVVTQDEIEASRQSNLLDFVRTHRPQWLRTRGPVGISALEVAVYLDGQRVGGPEQLRAISTQVTARLRYLDGREATTFWGGGHGNGAIMVTTGPLQGANRGRATFSDPFSG
jgi:hypothetical protein